MGAFKQITQWLGLWIITVLIAVPTGIGFFTLTAYYAGPHNAMKTLALSFAWNGLVAALIGILLHEAGFNQ